MNKLVNRILLLLSVIIVTAGQGFAADCLETATVWKDCVSAPGDTTINGVSYKKITTKKELAWLSKNYGNNAILLSDLDMGGKLWVPIAAGDGGGTRKYGKVFDGNHHRISNLYVNAEELLKIDSTYAQNLGFIGCLTGTVKNLIIENISVYGYGSGFLKDKVDTEAKPLSIGTVVGWQSNLKDADYTSLVDGCYVTGKIITSGDGQAVGGVVGNIGGGTLKNCVSYATIDANGKAYVGGIVGYAKSYENGKDSVSSCVYAGNSLSSTGSGAVGGIVGYQYKGDVAISDVVYDSDLLVDGKPVNGFGATNAGKVNGTNNPNLEYLDNQTTSVAELNADSIVCTLNGKNEDGTCKTEPWAMGETSLSLNGYGADGYEVIFDANGGVFSNGSVAFVKYVKADYIINNEGVENPFWDDDHAFAGWTSETTPEAYMNPANGVVTIKAIWNPVYTITFSPVNGDLNGTFSNGSSTPQTVKVEQGKQISVQGFDRPTSFTQNGVKYNFVGWANENNPTVAYVTNGLDNLPVATGNMTLVAVWTTADVWTVTFFADNASAASYVGSVYDNDKATPWVVEYTGYTFDAWYEKNNDGTFKDSPFDFNQVITQDYELHAKWTQNSYNITYVMNCSDKCVNPNDAQYTVDGLNLSNPTWDDAHRFLGWFKDSEFKNGVSSISVGSTGDLTLYAKWETVVYEITYRAGEYGNGLVDAEYKTHGVNYTIRNVSYTCNGATQTGWIGSNGENYGLDGAVYAVDAPLSLYPTWNFVEYTVEYNCAECTGFGKNPLKYTFKDTKEKNVSLYSPTYPSGYEWKGWFTDADYTNPTSNIPKGSYKNMAFYGKLLKKYSIIYVLNGGTKANSRDNFTVETATFALGEATGREGYTFAGWYDNSDFEGEAVTEVPLGSSGDKTFYAKWVKNDNGAITFTKLDDGTFSAEINGDYTGSETVEITENITVSGVTLTRSFNGNQVSTLMLPFDIDVDKVIGTPVYKYKTIVRGDDGRWKFKITAASKIYANTPYVVLPPETGPISFSVSAENTVIFNTTTKSGESVSSETSEGTWEFRGVYTYTELDEEFPEIDRIYVFANEPQNEIRAGQFVKADPGTYIKPMRAYLVRHNVTAKSARGSFGGSFLLPNEIDIEIEDEKGVVVETGRLNTVTGEVRMDRWFDLKGRKLNSKPSVKGTYYKNGKRVVIK